MLINVKSALKVVGNYELFGRFFVTLHLEFETTILKDIQLRVPVKAHYANTLRSGRGEINLKCLRSRIMREAKKIRTKQQNY